MEPERNLKFTLDSYFPPNFIFLGLFGVGIGITLAVIGKAVFGIIIILFSIPFSFTKRGTRINPVNKTISEFTSIAGIELGDDKPYEQLVKIKLKKEGYSQTMNSRGSSTTIRYTTYNAYLITDKESILLTGNKNRSKIAQKMESVAKRLGLELEIVE